MAKSVPLVLSIEDHNRLESITRTRTLQAQVVSRARILLNFLRFLTLNSFRII